MTTSFAFSPSGAIGKVTAEVILVGLMSGGDQLEYVAVQRIRQYVQRVEDGQTNANADQTADHEACAVEDCPRLSNGLRRINGRKRQGRGRLFLERSQFLVQIRHEPLRTKFLRRRRFPLNLHLSRDVHQLSGDHVHSVPRHRNPD